MLRQIQNTAILLLLVCFASPVHAQSSANPELNASFTSQIITIDGKMEDAWKKSLPAPIAIPAQAGNATVAGTTGGSFRALWDGAKLYLLIEVKDAEIYNTASRIFEKDGVEIYLDLWNDKYPKYEEDDGVLQFSSKGDRFLRGTDTARFDAEAVGLLHDKDGKQAGYLVEAAIHIGGLLQRNGTRIGLEIAINDIDRATNKIKTKLFWASGKNNGLDDNSRWGTILLTGYDGKSRLALDNYMLKKNIAKADGLRHGIWQDESYLQSALMQAKKSLSLQSQKETDKANSKLSKAIKGLRRKGPFIDPMDLPADNSLPNPFKLKNGSIVRTAEDWEIKKKEIRELVQYYEYGQMPGRPEKLAATLQGEKLNIQVEDKGRTAQFDVQLTLPADTQTTRKAPFPVIVSIDFFNAKPNPIYLHAGYAVLSIRYTAIASDNFEHKGPFYELYPYDVVTGNDAGTLLAWAWGTSRCVDALEFLAGRQDTIVKKLDLGKIVVTGFSRCGKAALAAGLFDNRFGVVSPGASGCGGAAVYRYVSFGNRPFSKPPYGHEYAWGKSFGCEVMPDKIRHQGHNSNEMLSRFLNPDRIYQTNTYGYGARLPYDHHEIIAAIAPRAVLITTANDDYANNAEGDAIGYEAAKKVYSFLGIPEKIGLNIRVSGEANPRGFGGGHWLSDRQISNLVEYADFIFFNKLLGSNTRESIYANPYLPSFEKYFGGISHMMP